MAVNIINNQYICLHVMSRFAITVNEVCIELIDCNLWIDYINIIHELYDFQSGVIYVLY